jgi:sialate O-acetylesterase
MANRAERNASIHGWPTGWRALAVLASLGIAMPGAAEVRLPRLFSDHMVVQRDQPLRLWGSATPGQSIAVSFGDASARAQAQSDGRWRIELPAPSAGGAPRTLRVDGGGDDVVVVRDVLVGDVWLASGQSNMEWSLADSADAAIEIARATDASIRHFKVAKSGAGTAQDDVAGGSWVRSSPAAASEFSAVAHLFARQMREHAGVPIGILDATWGGSRIEAWMDATMLGLDRATLLAQAQASRAHVEQLLADTRRGLSRWTLPANDARWMDETVDESEWIAAMLPGRWEDAGFPALDGVAWYRRSIDLSAAQANAAASISLGRIDDTDTVWINGTQVGGMTRQWNAVRHYVVPDGTLHAGRNHIAVRVTDEMAGGGVHGAAAELQLQLGDGTSLPLAGEWQFRVARAKVAVMDNRNQVPTQLYNAMLHPLQPFALRGVIWYQGEANADTSADAQRYQELFPSLIAQWRAQWHAPALPFLWVQLASFGSGVDRDGESPWARLRDAQSAALRLPQTAQVVSIDVGDADDIHPRNKQAIAQRLALAARKRVLGEALVASGPTLARVRFDGERAHVVFDLDGSASLAVRGDGALAGFELAGSDGRFHPASAIIDGTQTVVVRSEHVAKAHQVRYAWRDAPLDANLVNADGLPAAPFRSDAARSDRK